MVSAAEMLQAYARGIFPMAESRADSELHWVDPRRRGIIPLDGFHLSRSLRRRILRWPHAIRIDTAFHAVVTACGAREETWINEPLVRIYGELHALGAAHSLEVFSGDRLVGGVFGVVLGGAYFGESMFSAETDASKVALAYLVARLRAGGFTLFDTQFLTPHLKRMGGIEIPREDYRRRLADALKVAADFAAPGQPPDPSSLVASLSAAASSSGAAAVSGSRQRSTQTS